jgi:hypothetical protein
MDSLASASATGQRQRDRRLYRRGARASCSGALGDLEATSATRASTRTEPFRSHVR